MTEASQTQSVVVLDPDQLPAARALAAAHGVEMEEVKGRGIEPVVTVTLILVGTAAAVGAVLHVLEQRKGGQVIDMRPGAPRTFYRTPDVVYGTVVIIAVNGEVIVEVKEPEGMFGKVISILPELLSGGSGDVEQASEAITSTFGADVDVRTNEIPELDGGA